MIQGIKTVMTSTQLAELVLKRRDEHLAKAKRYEVRVKEMKEAGDNPAMMVSNDKSTIESFERRVQEHSNKAAEFQFLSDYLPKDEEFELSMSDLHLLEVVSRGY